LTVFTVDVSIRLHCSNLLAWQARQKMVGLSNC